MNYLNTINTAKDLLGCYLVHETKDGIIKGMIVETEAYLFNDEASHSFKGKTLRNAAMFGKPGTAYVYFTYGMHYCFNVVTNKEGVGEAVLIRALEPVEGIELMEKNRGVSEKRILCNGPAKLVQAMGITKLDNSVCLTKGKLRIEKGVSYKNIGISKRIGIKKSANELLRFYIKTNPYTSK